MGATHSLCGFSGCGVFHKVQSCAFKGYCDLPEKGGKGGQKRAAERGRRKEEIKQRNSSVQEAKSLLAGGTREHVCFYLFFLSQVSLLKMSLLGANVLLVSAD